MAEKTMRRRVVEALRSLHAVAVENPCCIGTPDINYESGWIELKEIDSWPKRPETTVRIDHYSQEQRLWALQRYRAGGTVLLILKVASPPEWLIFRPPASFDLVGKEGITREKLYQFASWRMFGTPQNGELYVEVRRLSA